MKTKILVSCGLSLLLAAAFGWGRESLSLRANVPFQFIVEGKTYQPGQYKFTEGENDEVIRVVSQNGDTSALALVVTQLVSQTRTDQQDADVVFDKVGDRYFLSEVWFPGADGFLVHATKEKHEHRTVKCTS